MVEKHHYSGGGSNTAVATHGLFPRGLAFLEAECRGVAWWLPPTKPAAKSAYPENWRGVLSLSRLVIEPGMPKNSCSFLLSKSMKLLDRERWPALVTYADEGRGHTGAIYKASNWKASGRTAPKPVYTLKGRALSCKAGTHNTRTKQQMLDLGCVLEGRFRKNKFVHLAKGAHEWH
jgi:hypothetical protein